MKICSSCDNLGMKVLANNSIVTCIDCNKFSSSSDMINYIVKFVTNVEAMFNLNTNEDEDVISFDEMIQVFNTTYSDASDDLDTVSEDNKEILCHYDENDDIHLLKTYPKNIINVLINLRKEFYRIKSQMVSNE